MRASFHALFTRILLIIIGITFLYPSVTYPFEDMENVAEEVATLFAVTRRVIADHQALINNPEVGDKGLTGDIVIKKAKRNYELMTKRTWVDADQNSLLGQAQQTLWAAVNEVMKNAQPSINRQGIGFKGFLPQIFGRDVAQIFTENSKGKISIKQTAPVEHIRNHKYLPDQWENAVLETKFRDSRWTRGTSYGEYTNVNGKPGYRYLQPEYYGESCLACHGGPKGRRDRMGRLKRGGELGELGGAISVVIYKEAMPIQIVKESQELMPSNIHKNHKAIEDATTNSQNSPTPIFYLGTY